MISNTLVKVGEINNLSDARYCASMGVDLLGFVLEESHSRSISDVDYTAITHWLEGPKYVGEFYDSSAEQIKTAFVSLGFSFIQLDDRSTLKEIESLSCKKILKVDVNSLSQLKSTLDDAKDIADYYLLESGNEMEIDEVELLEVTSNFPILLGYGLSAESIESTIERVRPAGIALKGGNEIRPGYKDYDELADILEAL